MISINYEHFKRVIDEFEVFNINTLKALYSKFGKQTVDVHFERYYNSLDENDLYLFVNRYAVFFEQKEKEEKVMSDEIRENASNLKVDKIINDTVYAVCFSDSECSIMSPEEEKKYGYDLLNCRNNLKISIDKYVTVRCGRGFNSSTREVRIIPLYPKLKLEDIFLSISDSSGLELLNSIKKLPYSLGDDSILKDEINDIKKYLLLCKNGIPDINILKENFPHLQFENAEVLSKEEINNQLSLLKDYIIARYNYYKRNLRLVISVAKRFIGKVPIEDAFQMGSIGLVKAIDRFDASKGNKFSTYATWWIRQAIAREIADTSNIIRIPVHMTEVINRYRRFVYEYNMTYLKEPTMQQCADELGVSLEQLSELKRASFDVVSLEAPVSSEENETDTLGMFIADETVSVEDDALSSGISEQLIDIMESCLKEKELFVLYERYGFNKNQDCKTLEEIGSHLGVTRERVRQIEQNALRKLKRRTKSLK